MTSPGAPLGVAILGFGTVGRSVARLIEFGRHPLRLHTVCTRRPAESRDGAPWVSSGVRWTDAFDDVLADGVDVVVEAIGGIEPARAWIARALSTHRSVVTANKQVMAAHGGALVDLARAQGVALRYEAAVGGAIPVVRGVAEGLAADHLERVCGVLNGTSTYVLGRMEGEGLSLEHAVADAQARGYAEADPAADLDGLDARAKLAILAAVGLGVCLDPAQIPGDSIRTVEPGDFAAAAAAGCTVRQVAWVEHVSGQPGAVRAFVAPACVERDSWLAKAHGPRNVVVTRGRSSGDTVFVGEGAGGDATAVAVVSDLLAVATGSHGLRRWPTGVATVAGRPEAPSWYVRVAGEAGHTAPFDPPAVASGAVRLLAWPTPRDGQAVVVDGPAEAAEHVARAWHAVPGARVVCWPVLR